MTCLDKFRHEFLDIISLEDENMEKRDTTLLLQVTETEKEFLLRCAEDTCLSLSDFVLLSALAINCPSKGKHLFQTGNRDERCEFIHHS